MDYWLAPHGLPYYTTRDYLARVGIAHSKLSLSVPIMNQENAPQICLQAI